MDPDDVDAPVTDRHGGDGAPEVVSWRHRRVLAVAALLLAAGFGQFGAVAALADVAAEFGEIAEAEDASLAEQAGLSGTVLGVGLAIIRLSSLVALPLASVADQRGRRSTLTWFSACGLALVVVAAISPGYWWFVLLFAASRPLLTATNLLGEITAAEQTGSGDRAKAVALMAAAYGVGAGSVAVLRGLTEDVVSFRWVFAAAAVPLVVVLLVRRAIVEPDRYRIAAVAADRPVPVLGAVARPHRRRLAVLCGVGFAVAVITGPANSFFFLYAENVLGMSASVTAALVVSAGAAGLAGLLLGRWGADRLGRRVTGAAGLLALAAAGVLTYSGAPAAAAAGYLAAVLVGSVFAPAVGSLHAELFPTSVRAATAGWAVAAGVLGAVVGLVAFGAVADAGDRFGLAAWVVFTPAAFAAALLWLVPETRGREPEDVAPDRARTAPRGGRR